MFPEALTAHCKALLDNGSRFTAGQRIALDSVACIGQFNSKPLFEIADSRRGGAEVFLRIGVFLLKDGNYERSNGIRRTAYDFLGRIDQLLLAKLRIGALASQPLLKP